jgi:hypothetical protein
MSDAAIRRTALGFFSSLIMMGPPTVIAIVTRTGCAFEYFSRAVTVCSPTA